MKGYEPTYTRTDLTDELNQFLGINIDSEIVKYKKIFENQETKN